ncbi:MAG TPA: hypothetical protein VH684_14070 [Xanthobacteraceae bacterium]|jgi:hypothetical protein
MRPPADLHDVEPSILAYVAALAAVFGLIAFGLYQLVQPSVLPNPGLAAYKAPASIPAPLTTSAEAAMAMEHSARVAAGDSKAAEETKTAGSEKPTRAARSYAARSYARRVPRVAARPSYDNRRPPFSWGYAQNPGFGRWF